MKKLFVLTMVVLLTAGIGLAAEKAMQEKVGDYTVTAKFDKSSLAVGENTLTVSISDKAGKAVTNAKVKVDYYMKERQHATQKTLEMPFHKATTPAEAKDSAYKAKLDLYMAGQWILEVTFTTAGKDQKVKFYVKV